MNPIVPLSYISTLRRQQKNSTVEPQKKISEESPVNLSITADQVTKLAPDASAASAGRKLSALKYWTNVGYNEQALWGECQGSALYQVRIELSTLTAQCSCPSRKLP